MLVDLISLVGIAFIQIWRSKDSTVFSLSNAVMSLACGGSILSAWYEVTRRIRALIIWSENFKYALYVQAAGFILVRYATLVAVNPRYIGTYIIVIIMLVFIGAVCIMNIIIISPKTSSLLKRHQLQDKIVEVYNDKVQITPPKEIKKKKRQAQMISRGSEECHQDKIVEVYNDEIQITPQKEIKKKKKKAQMISRGSEECHQDKIVEVYCDEVQITPPKRSKKKKKEAQIFSRGSEEYGNDGAADAVRNYADDTRLFLTVLLPGWILCLMKADSLVISQFLLFLSCSMGELTRMMASIPSEQAAPAFEVLHKGSVVVVLLTGHTMAVEALGHNYAVLSVTPELVAILVWLIFQLGYGGNFTARFFEDRRRRLFPAKTETKVALLSIAASFLAAYISLMIELEATNLLWSYYYDLFGAWFYSVVLPVLFALVLRLCWSTNKANLTPSEVEGAIQVLLCFALHVFVVGGLLVLLYAYWLRLELVDHRWLASLQPLFPNKWPDYILHHESDHHKLES